MKKLLVLTIVVAVIGALSVGVYAYGPRGGMMSDQRGNMQGRGWMHDRGPGGRGDQDSNSCPCGGDDKQNQTHPRWNAPGQSGNAPQLITEDKAKEAAQTFVTQYLPGYTIDKIEKNDRRPMYVVTLKGQNGAELQMLLRGFDGQVMHLFPKPAEKPAEQPAENK
jgi:hypothetical protein